MEAEDIEETFGQYNQVCSDEDDATMLAYRLNANATARRKAFNRKYLEGVI